MGSHYVTFIRPRHGLLVALGLILGCSEQPTKPGDPGAPTFATVMATDPSQVLTVGVDAPANVTVTGTVAGIVVAVDNAVVDLSGAVVDCRGQTTPDDPRVGVWIKDDRSHVYVKGGGTGVIRHCGAAVLVGPAAPLSGQPGGSFNQIDGLVVQEDECPSGPYGPNELLCPVGIALSNSHDNKVGGNRITQSEWGIVITGADPRASGANDITHNTIEGTQSFAIYLTSNGNSIRDNVTTNIAGQTASAIRVDGDGNLITGNELSACCYAVRLSDGADDNTVTKNVVPDGWPGFVAVANTFRNVFRENIALSTEGVSAIDESGGCVNNTWAKNTFASSTPHCIIGVTLVAAAFTSPTVIQLDGAAAAFSSTITNDGTKLTGVAIRSWVTQGPYTRRAGGLALVSCRGALGLLLRGTCEQGGNSVIASNGAGGRGTLAAGSATVVVELARLLDGDTAVMDSRSLPITITRPVSGSFWELRASMPTPRYLLAVGVSNDVLYAVGGYGTSWYTPALEAYDPVSDSWTARPSLPTQQLNATAAVVVGVLYVVGGYTGASYTGAVEVYDPATNTWSSRAPMPTPRAEAGLGVVNGVLYAVGGYTGNSFTGVVEAYDPATNVWTTKAPMPTPRRPAVGVIDGVLYAVGGYTGVHYSGAVEVYDPATDSWTTKASLPTQSTDLAVGVVNGVLYALGGGVAGAVEMYDPVTNTWAPKGSMPTPRLGFAVGVVNGVLYTVGGVPFGSNTILGAVEAYHP